MVAYLVEAPTEDATQTERDKAAPTPHRPAVGHEPPGDASVAQAQRESYLKKGEELIRSLL